MSIGFIFDFEDNVPTFDEIKSKLEKLTGETLPMVGKLICHPHHQDIWFAFSVNQSAKKIELFTTCNLMWYYLEATIAVLKDFGGKSETQIRPMVRQKWSEIKDEYTEHELFPFEWPDESEEDLRPRLDD